MTSLHSALTGLNLHEIFTFILDHDPADDGPTVAGQYWLNIAAEPYEMYRRNDLNDGWIQIGGGGTAAAVQFDGVKAGRVTNQSIPDATPTKFIWTVNFYDLIGDYLSGTSTQLILATGPSGYFQMYAQIRWGASAAGSRIMRIIRNGTDVIAEKVLVDAQGDDDMDIFTTFIMNNTDFIELELEQDSGGALDIVYLDFFTPVFGMHRMGN